MLLVWKSSIRYLFRNRTYLLFSIIGIAMGVSVVVAIDLASKTAGNTFKFATEAVVGEATHQIIGGPNGLPDKIFKDIKFGTDVKDIAPIVEGIVTISETNKKVTLLGIDPFSEYGFRNFNIINSIESQNNFDSLLSVPNTVAVSQAFLETLSDDTSFQLISDDSIQNVQIVGIINPTNSINQIGFESLIITDISTAQEILNSIDFLTRIDLKFQDEISSKKGISQIEMIVPSSVSIIPSGTRQKTVNEITKAFNLNLTALSLLALLVGIFLIYNTMTFSIIRRRNIIGILRAIGVTQKNIFLIFISEAIFLGIISVVLGVFLGILLAQTLLELITRTINDVFFAANVYQLQIDLFVLIKGSLLGIIASLIAAVIPSYEATRITPISAMIQSNRETSFRKILPLVSIVGLIFFIAGCILLLLPLSGVEISLLSLGCVTFGLTLQVPACTIFLLKAFNYFFKNSFSTLTFAAVRNIGASLSRISISIAALSLAVAVTIGIGLMIGSFRSTVEDWLNYSLVADIYISPPSVDSGQLQKSINTTLIQQITNLDEVNYVTKLLATELQTTEGTTQLAVVDSNIQILSESINLKKGNNSTVWKSFFTTNAIFVSEPYAYKNDIEIGDNIQLPTISGLKPFEVIGIYYDYSSSRGVILINRTIYNNNWNDIRVTSLALHTETASNSKSTIAKIEKLSKPYHPIEIQSVKEIKERSMDIFDRTFDVTSVLRLITIVVASIGILSSLIAFQIEKEKESAILRALGVTTNQFQLLTFFQTSIIGLISGLVAIPIGIIISWVLIHSINQRSFGWSMELDISFWIIIQGLLISILASMCAGIYPAFKNKSESISKALKQE